MTEESLEPQIILVFVIMLRDLWNTSSFKTCCLSYILSYILALVLFRGGDSLTNIEAAKCTYPYQTTCLLSARPPLTLPPLLLLHTSDIKINCHPTHPSFSKHSFINSFNSLYRASKAWEIIVKRKRLKIGFGRSNEMVIRFGQPPSNRENWVVKKSVVTSRGIQRACQQPLYDNPRHLPPLLRKGNPIEFWEALHVFPKIWKPTNTATVEMELITGQCSDSLDMLLLWLKAEWSDKDTELYSTAKVLA